jgi:undecaprenyl-diphosphatase
LAIGAALNLLPWDGPITHAAISARTATNIDIARRVSFLGTTKVVIAVSALATLAALPRSRRLAAAIAAIALIRPAAEWTLKELVGRQRPPIGDRLVIGSGPSFPSGHPLAAAASWCLIPIVVEVYVSRKWIWWVTVAATWALATSVAASRVWLGVHWTSDVVAALILAVLGVAGAEHAMDKVDARPRVHPPARADRQHRHTNRRADGGRPQPG